MMIFQKELVLEPKSRGFHLVTEELISQLRELRDVKVGVLKLFIQHTSASLRINENADATVRSDFEKHLNKMVPENLPYFDHIYEGADDMPAHIKASLLGFSVEIPITNGRLNLGTWQGVYLGEHRNYGGRRHVVATIIGE